MSRRGDPVAALVAADKRHVWHPFTQMKAWCADGHEPLVLVDGEGAILRDAAGREYIDGNASIWTNIHGHRHPGITAAIKRQLDRVAHVSFLGTTHPAPRASPPSPPPPASGEASTRTTAPPPSKSPSKWPSNSGS